jgi:hypothetical protein
MAQILARLIRIPMPVIRWRPGRGGALLALLVPCAVALCSPEAQAQVRATYLYNLSSFAGPLRDDTVRVSVDRERDEIYAVYQNIVRIYNSSGMEVFSFGDDLDLGRILDLDVDHHGDLIVLSYKDSRSLVTRCNFRGEPIGPIEIKNLPEGMVFGANRVVYRNGLLYFTSMDGAGVVITDANGEFREHLDLLSHISPEERQRSGAELFGFDVDGAANVYFTVPVLFKVFKRAPDGAVTAFGRSGSAPGRFGVVSGVAVDSRGNVLVTDKLKCAVIVFDKDFNFLTEFGYRGSRPGNLIVPEDVVIDRRDRLYVTQTRQRGVSVFALEYLR